MSRNRRGRGAERSRPSVAPGGLSGGTYRPLSEPDTVRIVEAAKEVLERTGIQVQPSPCRDTFQAAGCRIDSDSNRVYIPRKLVEDCLRMAPAEVLLAGRSPRHDLHLGGQKVYMGTGGQAVKVLDLDGRVRETRLSDNYDIGRLCDTLEHIHFYMRPVVARDLANEQIDINQFYACLAATDKHVMANAYLPEKVAEQRALGEMLAGGADSLDRRPLISYTACWGAEEITTGMRCSTIRSRISTVSVA